MDLGLNNKIAIVLAASKGLGLACANELYSEGMNVVICSRSENNLREAVNVIKKISQSNEILSVKADVRKRDDLERLVSFVLERFGTIDVVVHNAGGPPSGSIGAISKEQWSNSIEQNLLSFVNIANIITPIMIKQGSGRIIAITSVSVKQPLDNMVLSNTTRLGIVGFAKTLSNECAKHDVLVNVVCPGPNLTNRMKELIDFNVKNSQKTREEVLRSWTDQIPLGRLGTPEEVASLVVFLASKRASYITGTAIQVDGGFVRSPF